MKRFLAFAIAAVLSLCLSAADGPSTSLYLEFDKFTPTNLIFYDPSKWSGEDTSIPSPIEAIQLASAEYGRETASGSGTKFGVYWNLDTANLSSSSGSFSISLYFYSETQSSEDSGYMLRSDNDSTKGLNYSITQTSGSVTGINGISVSDPLAFMSISERSMTLVEKRIEDTGGEVSGWASFEATMNGFSDIKDPVPLGRYTGNIAIVVSAS